VVHVAMSPRGDCGSWDPEDENAGSREPAANPAADNFRNSLRVPGVKLSLQTAMKIRISRVSSQTRKRHADT